MKDVSVTKSSKYNISKDQAGGIRREKNGEEI